MNIKIGQTWRGDCFVENVEIIKVFKTKEEETVVVFRDEDGDFNVMEKEWFLEVFSLVKDVRETGTAYLKVSKDGYLNIYVEGCDDAIGYITNTGECHIQSCGRMHKATDFWRKHRCKIDNTPVEWRGGVYELIHGLTHTHIIRRKDIKYGHIWELGYGFPMGRCKDNNIVRNDKGTALIY